MARRTAHGLGIKTNASMLCGHIETVEERVEHMLRLRDLQDETGGFQTFIPFPFLPSNTELGRTRRIWRAFVRRLRMSRQGAVH